MRQKRLHWMKLWNQTPSQWSFCSITSEDVCLIPSYNDWVMKIKQFEGDFFVFIGIDKYCVECNNDHVKW